MSSYFRGGQQALPLVTVCVIGLCCTVYLIQVVLDLTLHHYTLCPRLVIYLHEYYRILTSSLFHASMMHIGMNMMSTAALGAMLERHIGSLRFLLTTLWSILLTSAVYITISYLWAVVSGSDDLMYQHSVGFSGVLFHYVVLESSVGDHRRSIFGVVQVPAYLYPWALLIVLQFIMPNLSLLGHLAGILTGSMQLSGLLESFAMPSTEALQWLELDTTIGVWISSRSNYVRVVDTDVPSWTRSSGSSNASQGCMLLVGKVQWAIGTLLAYMKHLVEALWVIVMGRGRAANANVQIVEWWRRLGISFSPSTRDTTTITTAHAWSPVPVTDVDGDPDQDPLIATQDVERAMV